MKSKLPMYCLAYIQSIQTASKHSKNEFIRRAWFQGTTFRQLFRSCKKIGFTRIGFKVSSGSTGIPFTSLKYPSQMAAFRSPERYHHSIILLDEPITTGAVEPIHMNRVSSHDDGPFIRAGWWQLRQGSTPSAFIRSTLQPFHGRQ